MINIKDLIYKIKNRIKLNVINIKKFQKSISENIIYSSYHEQKKSNYYKIGELMILIRNQYCKIQISLLFYKIIINLSKIEVILPIYTYF